MQVGALMFGRFELVHLLGTGGVATVWRTLDREANAAVALKILHPHLRNDPVVCERFRREVAIGRKLRHPGIVQVHALFEDANALAFSLDLLTGRTLRQRLIEHGALPPSAAVQIALACLDALAFAHTNGVVHRDVKPHNIFLCDTGDVRLLDFGFARVANAATLTTKSVVLCTPEYAAPETIAGQAVDGRADLYSLGVVLFEILLGTPPFVGRTPYQLLRAHVEAPVAPLIATLPGAPSPLSAVIERLLAKAPHDRFPDCDAVAAALRDPTPRRDAPVQPPRICAECGETVAQQWPLCPACGAWGRQHSEGDWLAALTRSTSDLGARDLATIVRSLGLVPSRQLRSHAERPVSGLPKLIAKGIHEHLALRLRAACQTRGFQVELRRIGEANADLLHRANTPGYLFLAGIVVPWMAALVGALDAAREASGSILANTLPTALVAAAGPLIAWLLLKKAHWFLIPLSKLPPPPRTAPFPRQLATRYQEALRRLEDRTVIGTLQRLFERALTVFAACSLPEAMVAPLFDLPRATALKLAERGLDLADAVDDARRRLDHANAADLTRTVMALRARAAEQPPQATLAVELAAHEHALHAIDELEEAHVRASEQLLRLSSGLEVSAARLLGAHTPAVATVSQELKRLFAETEIAIRHAQDLRLPPRTT